MAKNEVAAQTNKALVAATMYEDDANQGFEEANRDSYAIPFLAVLQSGSPQCKKSDGAYIKGAEEGMLFNTVSEQTVDGTVGVQIIPVHYKQSFIEWKPRESGGGFVAEHGVADGQSLMKQTTKDKDGHDCLPNGNFLVDTRSHYVLVLKGDGAYEPAVMSMSSTQMKKSRRWMTVMQNLKMTRGDGSSFTPPMFSHQYHVTTVPESNDKGSWFGWKIAIGDKVEDAGLYSSAKSFRDAILSGEAKEQTPVPGTAEAEEF